MSAPPPLAGAAQRLRGKPGRPRKTLHANQIIAPMDAMSAAPTSGATVSVSCLPRLLDLGATAAYLGVSSWTVRDLEAAGTLSRVRVPVAGGGDLRKLLFDRQDLDRLVEAWKA